MASFRVNFFFRQFKQGWTETWYWTGTDLASAGAAAQAAVIHIMAPRSTDTVLDAFKVVQVDPPIPRVSLRIPSGQTGSRAFGGEDVVTSSALMTANFNDNTQKPYLVRGLADGDVLRDPVTGAPTPTPNLIVTLADMATGLRAGGFTGRRQSAAFPLQIVVQLGPNANFGFTDINVIGLVGISLFDIVHFRGVPLVQVPWLRGNWTVWGLTATTISIQYPWKLATVIHPSSMLVQKVGYTYPGFLGWAFQDFRSRKTGRPTSLTRGRSRGITFRRSTRAAGG